MKPNASAATMNRSQVQGKPLRKSMSMDPARLARYFDLEHHRMSYSAARVSPYSSLDLSRPMSALSASLSAASLQRASVNGSVGTHAKDSKVAPIESASGLSLGDSGVSLLDRTDEVGRNFAAPSVELSTLKNFAMTAPSLPETTPRMVNRLPLTEEQESTLDAAKFLERERLAAIQRKQDEEMAKAEALAQSGGLRKPLFVDSKFMFGFVSRQKAEMGNVPPPTDSLGRLSTVDERREEMIAVARERAARILIKKAKAQRDRRTQLIEVRHPYLFEGDSHGGLQPSQDFLLKQNKRRDRQRRKRNVQARRHARLEALQVSQTQRGFDPFVDVSVAKGQVPVSRREKQLFQGKGRVMGPGQNRSTADRLWERNEKPKNMLRSNELYNRNVGCKNFNIITGEKLAVQPTRDAPKPRSDAHPSIIIHGHHDAVRPIIYRP